MAKEGHLTSLGVAARTFAASMSFAFLLFIGSLTTAGAAGQENANPSGDNTSFKEEEKAWAKEVLAHTPDSAGIWELDQDGAVRHIQSGLLCRAKYPHISLWRLMNFPSQAGAGMDVGCDYVRAVQDSAESKLSVFATKAAQDETLENAFQRYRAEVFSLHPDAKSRGMFELLDQSKSEGPIAERSEEFQYAIEGKSFASTLTVSLVNGWVVEIRATYPAKMADGIDQLGPPLAWFLAVMSIRDHKD